MRMCVKLRMCVHVCMCVRVCVCLCEPTVLCCQCWVIRMTKSVLEPAMFSRKGLVPRDSPPLHAMGVLLLSCVSWLMLQMSTRRCSSSSQQPSLPLLLAYCTWNASSCSELWIIGCCWDEVACSAPTAWRALAASLCLPQPAGCVHISLTAKSNVSPVL